MRELALPAPVIVALVCGILPAQAADVAEPAPAPEAVVTAPQYNWYIAARIGAAFADDTEFGVLGTTVTNDYDTGWVGSAAVGTQFDLGGFRPRAEIEMGYLSNEVDSHDVAGIGRFEGDDAFGKTNVFFGLVNGYLDFLEGPLKPYVSAGLGFGHVDFDNHGITAVGTAMDDSATGFAWQVGAGISYAFTPQTTMELGYRYFSVENVGLVAVDGTESDVDIHSNQVMLGLRYAF